MAYQDVKTPWEDWRVINEIGRGGFGVVYEVERSQYGIQERAAMKVITIPQSLGEIDDLLIEGYDPNSITQRFDTFAEDIVREYGMMAQMKGNANIVYCDDYRIIQQDNGFGRDIYIRMELLTPLLKAVDRVSSETQIIRFGMEMCNALEACQKRKVIHRDIKPQNIFVSNDGIFKLGDFGIARKAEKTTRATVGKGTYQFMAPEVKNEQPYGPTVDIYSLGLVMYWLLNERRSPFLPLPPTVPTYNEQQEAFWRRFSGEKIPAPKCGSEELKRIVLKACAFDPKDRYQYAREMREDLMRLSGEPVISNQVSAVVADMDEEETVVTSRAHDMDTADDIKTVGPAFVKTADDIDMTDDAQTVGPVFYNTADDENGTDTEKPIVSPHPRPKRIGIIAICFIAVAALIAGYFGIHFWTTATCTEPSVCKLCGKEQGAELGHKWIAASCATPRTCSVCGVTEGDLAEHTWQAATCTTVKTCSACGVTEGDLAEHTWQAATCTTVKTCSVCGVTEGDLAEHTWQAATCTTVKTCSACGVTEGNLAEHAWQTDATATVKTCSVCGATVYTNPLTGETLEKLHETRIFAVAIDNDSGALPHVGTMDADIVFEMYVRGYATRCLALFSDIRKAEIVGPLRSWQYNFTDIAVAYDAFACHAGINTMFTSDGSQIRIDHYNADTGDQTPYSFRDKVRSKAGYDWEHCLFLKGEGIYELAGNEKVRLTRETEKHHGMMFVQDATPVGGETANKINLTFKIDTHSKLTSMTYRKDEGKYAWTQYGEKVSDVDAENLELFENVLILFADFKTESGSYHVGELDTTGDGYFACNGMIIPIKWIHENTTDAFSFTLVDGTPLYQGIGNSYIGICPMESDVEWE